MSSPNPSQLTGLSAVTLALAALFGGLTSAMAQESSPGSGSGGGTGEASSEAPAPAEEALTQALERFENDRAGASAELLTWLDAHLEDDTLALSYSRELNARRAFDESLAFLHDYVARREASGHADTGASLELGGVLLTLLRYEEAATYLERVPPGNNLVSRLARLNLGKVYRALGRFEEARAVYATALESSSAVFAQAALCEIALALEGPEAARTCVAEGRARFGQHAAFEQPEILTAYLQGDLADALALLDAAFVEGQPSARLSVLRPLLVLAVSGPGEARAAVDRVDQITTHGERDALAAVVAATAGDSRAAAVYYESAVGQNALFASPARAGRVLFWRPEVVAALERARAAVGATAEAEGTGAGEGSGEGTGRPQASGPPVRRHETGCCRVATGTGGPVGPLCLLALAWRSRRSRRQRTAPPRAQLSTASD